MSSRLSKQLHYLLPDRKQGSGKGPNEQRQTEGDSCPVGEMSYGKVQYWLINDGDRLHRLKWEVKLINYLYLHNETTLILVSRSGRKQADLSCAFNVVGISLITKDMERRFSLHRKPIVHPDHLSQPRLGHCSQDLVGKVVLVGSVPESFVYQNVPAGREDTGMCTHKQTIKHHCQTKLN